MAALRASAIWLLVATSGCGTLPAESPAARAIVLSDAAPPAGYVKLQQLDVVHGRGCGLLGSPGSAAGAQAAMRAAAVKIGAAYVQVTGYEEPPLNRQCKEHQHQLHGTAYRLSPASVPAPLAPSAAAPSPLAIQNYEEPSPASEPSAPSTRSRLILTLTAGDGSATALSVRYFCSGEDQRADLDVWSAPLISDWNRGKSLSLRVKPEASIALSVSFIDGNHASYTQQTEPLVAGQWQSVALPFDQFRLNPLGPQGDGEGASLDRGNIRSFGFAPLGCSNGQFLIDDVTLLP